MKKALIDYTYSQNQYVIAWTDRDGAEQQKVSEFYHEVVSHGKSLKEEGIVQFVENHVFPEHSI